MSEGHLGLDPDELNACVACGLCLPHCPTYRISGREVDSPRGRIAAMRLVETGAAPIDAAFRDAMEACVGCRGCEAACPSSVPFGHLMVGTRAALPPTRSVVRRAVEHFGYRFVLPRHRVLLLTARVLGALRRLRLVPRRWGIPPLTVSEMRPLGLPVGGNPDVWLFTGCVMDAWMRSTHRSAARVIGATGASVAVPTPGGACCGALHHHAGRRVEAERLAERVMASMPGSAPIVVDSAGCGAMLKEYGELLGTEAARAFAARVHDFAEWVVAAGTPELVPDGRSLVIQDPCHLRHVQKAHEPVRTLLAPAYRLVETADDALCCGAGGAFSLVRPTEAAAIRDRKIVALRAADPDAVVVSANPGCVMHLRAGGLTVAHPADLAAAALP